MLMLPWRARGTLQLQEIRERAGTRRKFTRNCKWATFAVAQNPLSKNSPRPLDAIDPCDRQSKDEALLSCGLRDGIIVSDLCDGGYTPASLCKGSSSIVRSGKRAFIACSLAALLMSSCTCFEDCLPPFLQNSLGLGVAHASLVQMPPEFLNNRYYLVRAGESEFERIGVINTNPVTKTNMESGLSENGKKQTVKAALQLREMGACDGSCWIWPSITQRAYQAAEIIANLNNITRSRIVPEYSFLDARGVGAYEGKSLSFLSKIYELDAESASLRPPPYTDGTPNESVADVFVRVTQLMSILETQYYGESIIIVAPDSDNLSILQAALTGLDLRRHIILAFPPGEVRYVDLDDRPPQARTRPSGLVKCETPSRCG